VGAAGDDGAEQALKQGLYEYVAFALFSAGGALGAAIESSIAEDVRPMLEEIMPTG
jgi:hypothetical protein